MAVRPFLLPLVILASACTQTATKPFPIDATIFPLDLTLDSATYASPPHFGSFQVTNNMGSIMYISPAVPSGDGSDLLVVDVPAFTQVAPGQTKVVQVTLDYRPWRWTTGDYTATLPFEVRYFFSGQAKDAPEEPSTTEKPKVVADVLSLTVHFSINCDLDGDGYDSTLCHQGSDCDDRAAPANGASIFVGAPETCDNVDQNCNGAIDEDATDATSWYYDGDNDGDGDPAQRVDSCSRPSTAYVLSGRDCNDADRTVNSGPDTFEICGNGVDDNCDGKTDGQDHASCP